MKRNHYAVLMSGLFFYATASAATFGCLKWFYSAAPSNPSKSDQELSFEARQDKLNREFRAAPQISEYELLRQTYAKLLDSLGSDAEAATLQAMVRNRAVFDLPPQPGADLSSLRSAMKDLQERVKLWNQSTINDTLVPELKKRIRKLRAAE